MIYFDGIDIQSIANVCIEDIRVSKIQTTVVSRPRAINAGSEFVRTRFGTRTIAVTFALLQMNMDDRMATLRAISEWAKSDKEYKLELPGHPDHYLMAVCTDKPEPSTRQWWESKLRLVFTCISNPFWISNIEKSVPCGTNFVVMGDAPPLMRIVSTYATADGNITYSLGNNLLTFNAIPAGDIEIDLNKQTAVTKLNSTSTTPELRNGSTGNPGNAYAVTTRYVQRINHNYEEIVVEYIGSTSAAYYEFGFDLFRGAADNAETSAARSGQHFDNPNWFKTSGKKAVIPMAMVAGWDHISFLLWAYNSNGNQIPLRIATDQSKLKITFQGGSTSIAQSINANSHFLVPQTGEQIISGRGTVKYRERWQ